MRIKMNISPELQKAIEAYCLAHAQKYNKGFEDDIYVNCRKQWSYEVKQKFVRVYSFFPNRIGQSAHCFIQIADEGPYKAGDIFKPASWKAPIKNFVRGNVFTEYHVSVYGL
jgi:hypothetical protein